MEEGGWKLLLAIDTESLYKIRLAKKDDNSLLMTFRTSLFRLPASKLYKSKILIPNPEVIYIMKIENV
ncbi:hypothetical protein [Chryseobacterium vaccae]|nr:hypothetical protein [Chryseobacterium vaccae]